MLFLPRHVKRALQLCMSIRQNSRDKQCGSIGMKLVWRYSSLKWMRRINGSIYFIQNASQGLNPVWLHLYTGPSNTTIRMIKMKVWLPYQGEQSWEEVLSGNISDNTCAGEPRVHRVLYSVFFNVLADCQRLCLWLFSSLICVFSTVWIHWCWLTGDRLKCIKCFLMFTFPSGLQGP